MKQPLHKLAFSIGIALLALPALAADPSILNPSGLPVPRFVSLKSDEVNARVGPGERYPVRFVYRREGLPVEVVEEFAHWRKIRDMESQGGWVHKNLLSAKRTAVVIDRVQTIYARPDTKYGALARAEPRTLVELKECAPDWCQILTGPYLGWIRKTDIWGATREEVFE
jgi:SH3-like domain-containing protein